MDKENLTPRAPAIPEGLRDILPAEAKKRRQRDMVRFMGSDGRLLALRPEMTTTIARVAAQRLDPSAEPHRPPAWSACNWP